MRREKEIRQFNAQQIAVHWIHTAAFLTLLVTGLFIFIPSLSSLMGGGYITRYLHRIFAVAYIGVPLLFLVTDPKGFAGSIRQVLTWGRNDWLWLKAAPGYYFLNREEKMPPQEKLNTGQKLWYLLVLVATVLIIGSGLVMWFGRETVGVGVFQVMIAIHDLSMIPLAVMFFVHFYMGVLHPSIASGTLFRNPMITGMTKASYAKRHHTKWYERVTGEKGE
jgi:formate dehydrogenase subunit gamma